MARYTRRRYQGHDNVIEPAPFPDVQDKPGPAADRGEDGDVQREYNRQREHLERNVEALKSSIDKV